MRFVICVLLIALAGCATEKPRPVDDAPVKAALRVEIDCAMQNLAGIDDGISDGRTVALGLATRCAREYQAVTEAIASTLGNDTQREGLRRKRQSAEAKVEEFIDLVLSERARVRKKLQ